MRIVLMTALALLTGCSASAPPPEREALVRGQVTFKGKPISLGKVTFLHASADPVFAAIGPDGRFELLAIVGTNMVAVECRDPDRPNTDPKAKRSVIAGQSRIPVRYAEPMSSGLRAEVKDGDNEVNFALQE